MRRWGSAQARSAEKITPGCRRLIVASSGTSLEDLFLLPHQMAFTWKCSSFLQFFKPFFLFFHLHFVSALLLRSKTYAQQ